MTNHRLLLCLFLMMFVLAACDQFTRNDQLTTAEEGNSVAVSNLNLGIEYMQQQEYEKSLEKLNKAGEKQGKGD